MIKSKCVSERFSRTVVAIRELHKKELAEALEEDLVQVFNDCKDLDAVGVTGWRDSAGDYYCSVFTDDLSNFGDFVFSVNQEESDLYNTVVQDYISSGKVSTERPDMMKFLYMNANINLGTVAPIHDSIFKLRNIITTVFETNFWVLAERTDEGVKVTYGVYYD